MILQGSVTPPGNNATGTTPQVPASHQGELLVSELHGKWYNACYNGKVFTGASAVTGTSFPIYTSTTGSFMLWNTSNTVNLELISFRLGWISGTFTTGTIGYAMFSGAGSATNASVISTFTNAPTYIRSGLIGQPGSGNASLANATVTYVAPTIASLIPGNMSATTLTGAGTLDWLHDDAGRLRRAYYPAAWHCDSAGWAARICLDLLGQVHLGRVAGLIGVK